MELDNRERYASAALFTLALHSSQVDNWVPAFVDVKMQKLRSGSSQSVMAAWGCPDPDGFPFEMRPDLETATFWGWDSVRCAFHGGARPVSQSKSRTISTAQHPARYSCQF